MTSTKSQPRRRTTRILWTSAWGLLTIASAVVTYAVLVFVGR